MGGLSVPRLSFAGLMGAALLLFATGARCKGRAAQEAFYTIEAPRVTLGQETKGRARIRFVARKGYHWNEEFPARLDILEAIGLEVPKKRFLASAKDFQVESGAGVLEIPLEVASEGPPSSVIRAAADFSVCNDKECRIFKGIALEVQVDVH